MRCLCLTVTDGNNGMSVSKHVHMEIIGFLCITGTDRKSWDVVVVVFTFKPSSSLIQVLRVYKAQFSYRLDGSVP